MPVAMQGTGGGSQAGGDAGHDGAIPDRRRGGSTAGHVVWYRRGKKPGRKGRCGADGGRRWIGGGEGRRVCWEWEEARRPWGGAAGMGQL